MATERAAIFNEEDFDLSEFQPASTRPDRVREKQAIHDMAVQKGFVSREPALTPAPESAPGGAAPQLRRRYTTGRNRQLNMKVTDEALKRFYSLADAHGWVLGEAFEKAIGALERELASIHTDIG